MADASSVFLLIFLVSLGFTLVTLALGHLSIPGLSHLHIGDADGGVGHGHLDAGHVHVGHDASGIHGGHDIGGGISPFNMATVLAFLTWFGGTGYILTGHFSVVTVLAVVLSAGSGLVGAAIVFFFLARILLPGQTPYLDPGDFELVGTVGRLSVSVGEGRTGEITYSMGGTRRGLGARSVDGKPIEQGTEVVIVEEKRGIAYVQRWEEFVQQTEAEGAPD